MASSQNDLGSVRRVELHDTNFFRSDCAAEPMPAPRSLLGEIPEHGGSGTG
jgi:hypothetical protein